MLSLRGAVKNIILLISDGTLSKALFRELVLNAAWQLVLRRNQSAEMPYVRFAQGYGRYRRARNFELEPKCF